MSVECDDPKHVFRHDGLPNYIPRRFIWTCECGLCRLDLTFHGSLRPVGAVLGREL